jgi:hypothetical protein
MLSFSFDATGLDLALDGSREFHLGRADLRQVQPLPLELPPSRISIREGIVAITATEARRARSLPGFHTPKKGFHRLVQAEHHILKHVAGNLLILWPEALLDLQQIAFLLVATSRLACLLVGFPTLLEGGALHLAPSSKDPFEPS